MKWHRSWFVPVLALVLGGGIGLAEKSSGPSLPDLTGYRTVDQAITTKISLSPPEKEPQPGYLGLLVEPDAAGRLVVQDVDPESPAAKAGVRKGDVVKAVAGKPVADLGQLKALLQSRTAGDSLKLGLLRQDRAAEVMAKLTAPSRPLDPRQPRVMLGVRTLEVKDGLQIDELIPGMAAEKGGLKPGDVLIKVDGEAVTGSPKLAQILEDHRPGDTVKVAVKRKGKDVEVKLQLTSAPSRRFRRGFGGGGSRMTLWKKGVYRLAVVPVEFPDVKHNAKVGTKEWEKALFSKDVYKDKSPTGQKVYGSLNDYYREQSCEGFHVEGKVFNFVRVDKKRGDYLQMQRFALLNEALDKLLARDGKDALKDYDGLFFLYAGGRVQTQRGGLYWPHRAMMNHKGKRWAYFICPEGGRNMSSISVIAHEFGHMLGLPDLYARPEMPGSKGLGIWCTMSTGHGQDGKPLHFCAWSKEQLGWIRPAVIDPRTRQKLILSPIEGSKKECYKVLVRPDGSEYLLLENRIARGFDRDLPGQGLLIWRVVDGKPILQESHGINGPEGPSRFLGSIPYPSRSNRAYTPATIPSSKPVKKGGLEVYITNIRKLPDGRIIFVIGYEYL